MKLIHWIIDRDKTWMVKNDRRYGYYCKSLLIAGYEAKLIYPYSNHKTFPTSAECLSYLLSATDNY